MSPRTRYIVGLSGGVDSAVAALLLLEQGHAIQGLFMRNWEDDDTATYCSAEQDLAYAKQVCAQLDIPLHVANFAHEYRAEVFDHCLREYRRGHTPNPDILCNQRIKFHAFINYAQRLGTDHIATGHYARNIERHGTYHLFKAKDADKDQSYFLYTLGQRQLARATFPLGEHAKSTVRALAEQAGFDNFDRKDSTGICFIGERAFRPFLSRYIQPTPGPIETPEGVVVGRHQGVSFYTLGQRQGLEIGGRAGRSGKPWYVVGKDTPANRLIVAQGHDHPLLMSVGLEATELCWVAGRPPSTPLRCFAKTRYRQPSQSCVVEAITADCARTVFDQPQRAVVPGQSVVFYCDEECIGGGVIQQTFPWHTHETRYGIA
ncbi:tRNA 2-thiouridine(34) synthase MnmA [Nitrococcus mobilis]|uniref:tRNA-specific 2-thiouridylase MnmA n=1 Tax=Nitrococcus mobilis Nb-231 TaxID=314278 RepID=A4BTH3_9GAMM|nr:tRNA 2-thiouridine(34) synthase MnmA [Nitrococcus mobilis]EAR20929.1 tRNA (5-methylaminomethyl-2-thiouridylate)-methyltransferase [Nitrococcus mobilis Nb-231]